MQRKLSSTGYPIVFFMADAADHVTGKTGLTPSVTISKNGGAFGAASGAVSELSNGWYALAGNATDRGTLGALALHASASGADPADVLVEIVSHDPFEVAEPGDAMTLTSAYDAAKTAASQTSVDTVDTVVDAIKVKTDNLPASPAAVGSQMALNSTAVDNLTSEVWQEATRSLTDKVDFSLTSAYDAAKTAASQTSVNTVDTVVDSIKSTVDTNLDMKVSDIDPSVAISVTEAASVATGKMDISVYYTFDQTVTSTYAGDLSAATKIWFSVKENVDTTDENSLVLMEKTGGLTVVNKTTYATTTHGNIVVTGSSGDWDVQVKIDEAATSNLSDWDNAYYFASVKALIGGDAVHIWDGECRITSGVVRTYS